MTKHSIICPACGSDKVKRSEQESFGQLTLGEKFSFKEINYQCGACGEEGDFLTETDKNYLTAQKSAQLKLVKTIIENLSHSNISMATFERVFELPARTLTRWKNGDFSASALALLRIIVTYPWITEVAEHRFEKNLKNIALMKEAVNELNKAFAMHLQSPSINKIDITSDSGTTFFNAIISEAIPQRIQQTAGG